MVGFLSKNLIFKHPLPLLYRLGTELELFAFIYVITTNLGRPQEESDPPKNLTINSQGPPAEYKQICMEILETAQ
jgi:hypothetical protein